MSRFCGVWATKDSQQISWLYVCVCLYVEKQARITLWAKITKPSSQTKGTSAESFDLLSVSRQCVTFQIFFLKEITNLSQLSFPAQGNLLTDNDKGCFGFKKRIRITYKYTIRIKQTSGGFSHIYVYVCRWKSKQGSLCGLKSLRHHHRLKVHQQSHLIS